MSSKHVNHHRSLFLLLMQFAVILMPFALFADAAFLYKGRMNLTLPLAVILLVILNGGLLVLTLFSIIHFSSSRKEIRHELRGTRIPREKWFFSYIPVALVAFVFTVLAVMQFDGIPRYDGGLYYDAFLTATETFSFTIDSFVSSFMIWTHPMQGTSLLLGAGEMLFPRQAIGIYIMTLIISLIAIFCMYGIMGRIFPEQPSWLKASGAGVFAFCPYVLGLFAHISPDYYTAMFFIIFVYLFSVELDYLAGFLSLLLIFSRETGILFAAFFLLPAILLRAGKAEGANYFSKLKTYLFPRRLFIYSAAPLVFAYYVLFSKGLTFGEAITEKSSFRWDSSSYHCFGFNFNYISARLQQILFLNFFWIGTVLFFAAVLVYFFRKRKHPERNWFDVNADTSIISGIVLGILAYSVFTCLYITLVCPRYNVYYALPFSIICVAAITGIWKNKTIVKFIMGGLILALLLQNYFNIDPSLLSGHEKINLGYQYIYSPTKYQNDPYVCEMYVYNRTHTYSEELLDKALKNIDPDKDVQFLLLDGELSELYLIGDPAATTHLIYWDPIQKKRTYDYLAPGAFVPVTYSVSRPDILSGKVLDLADDFYFILTAREDETACCAALESRGYLLTESFAVSNYIGYLDVYHFSKK